MFSSEPQDIPKQGKEPRTSIAVKDSFRRPTGTIPSMLIGGEAKGGVAAPSIWTIPKGEVGRTRSIKWSGTVNRGEGMIALGPRKTKSERARTEWDICIDI